MIQGLITVSEAAQLKGVSRSVLYKAIGRGDLKVKIVLGKNALLRQDVLAWEPRQAGRHQGTPLSEEAKRKISAGQKARWQKLEAENRRVLSKALASQALDRDGDSASDSMLPEGTAISLLQ